MNQPDQSTHNSNQRNQGLTRKRFASTLPAQGLGWLGSVSLLSGGFVFAQTNSPVEIKIPTAETSQTRKATTQKTKKSSANSVTIKSQPDFAARRARLRQRLNRAKAAQTVKPKRRVSKKANSSPSAVVIKTPKPQVQRRQVKKVQTPVRTVPQRPAKVAQPVKKLPLRTRLTNRKRKDYNNAYIDPTRYKTRPTGKYQAPTSVVVKTRTTGCKTIFSQQEISAGACGRKTRTIPSVANTPKKSTPSWLKQSTTASLTTTPTSSRKATVAKTTSTPKSTTTAKATTTAKRRTTSKTTTTAKRRTTSRRRTIAKQTTRRKVVTQVTPKTPRVVKAVAKAVNRNQSWSPITSNLHTKKVADYRRFIPQPSALSPTTTVSDKPIAPSFGTLPVPMAEGNIAPRPSQVSYDFALASVLPEVPYTNLFASRGGSSVMFPLSVPSPVTSLFGWRIHPISGDRRFHTGTDLGAPTGTPIVAAAKGQVQAAHWMGGYGLTVTINHSSAQQTLYGHMSEILVRPGELVEAGTVIGRVGSTGNSTGPHLHFEVRHLTANGWVAVDPSVKLRTGLYNLLDYNRLAQNP